MTSMTTCSSSWAGLCRRGYADGTWTDLAPYLGSGRALSTRFSETSRLRQKFAQLILVTLSNEYIPCVN